MKKSFIGIISFILSIALSIGILPTVAFAESAPTTWPKLTDLSLAEGVQLIISQGSITTHNRDVVKAEYENYDALKLIEEGKYSAGVVTLHITEALNSAYQYKLSGSQNSLVETFTEMPEGYSKKNTFEPASFQAGKTEAEGRVFAKDSTNNISIIYEFEIVVDPASTQPEYNYPVLTKLDVGDNAVLTGLTDQSTILITGAKFENYAAAEDGTTTSGKAVKVPGKVTIYIAHALGNQRYQLKSQNLMPEYTTKDGFTTSSYFQGSFAQGETTSLSSYYAVDKNVDPNVQYHYAMELVVGYPDDGVYLTEGSSVRVSSAQARITFHSNKAGTFYYAVVDASAADAPAMPETGAAMSEGTNTFVASVTDGAKKVYIWGKDSSGQVSKKPLIVEVGAEAVTYRLYFSMTKEPTDGVFKITAQSAGAEARNISFKTSVMDGSVSASGLCEGDVVTVWMGNPYSNKDLKAVALTTSDASKTPVSATVSGDSFTFTMPAAGVRSALVEGSANKWRTYEDSSTTRYTLVGTTSTYDKTDASGIAMGRVLFTDESGNTIKQATTGAKVTATAVADTTNQFLEFQFTEWSDAQGFELSSATKNADGSITFTVGEEDISVKANFEAVGTKVTWGTDIENPADYAPTVLIAGGLKNPSVFKSGSNIIVQIRGTEWYDRYEFLGWTVMRDGQKVDVTTAPAGTEGQPGYWTQVNNLEISGREMTITANFRERSWGEITVSANDSSMGSASVSVNGKDTNMAFEGQTVTLTANPNERYQFVSWTVTDNHNQPITVTVSTENPLVATFAMPSAGGNVTAVANFQIDPTQASKDCVMSAVELYDMDGNKIASGDKEGTTFTITLGENVDTTNLSTRMNLKFTCSQYAKVMCGEETWPADGKACGMNLNESKIFTVVAEDGTTKVNYTVIIKQERTLSSEKAITAVKLLNGATTIATGTLSGNVWTIDLPSDTEQALLDKIGASTEIKMQIDYTGASVAQEDGYSDASAAENMKWSSGNVMCAISPNSQADFTVTAEDSSTANYVIKITYTAPASSKPMLSNGAATRTSDTAATVTFTSSAAGSYYYTVVNAGAAEPEIETTGSGTSASAGTNTISLTNLTAGARDIYIAVKSASGEISDNLKIAIPAFGEEPGGDTPTEPDTGDFTITVSCPTGGTITTSRTKANRGDEITVTATPDSGYQLVAGSLKFTLGVAGGESTVITNGKFTMPSCDVTVSCKWEKVQTVVSGITAFSIDGVQGVVDNSTNTISVVMPYGTDVSQLIPTISGNHIASISPASGKMVNFTKPVTYTVTLTDGTTKQYTVTVYVQKGTQADQMWDKLTDFYNQTPWWEYADNQISTGHYPKYW